MAQEKENVKEIHHPVGVRIDGARLLQIVELKGAVDLQEAGKTKDRNRTEADLKQFQRSQGEEIQQKSRGMDVIQRQFRMIVDQQT